MYVLLRAMRSRFFLTGMPMELFCDVAKSVGVMRPKLTVKSKLQWGTGQNGGDVWEGRLRYALSDLGIT